MRRRSFRALGALVLLIVATLLSVLKPRASLARVPRRWTASRHDQGLTANHSEIGGHHRSSVLKPRAPVPGVSVPPAFASRWPEERLEGAREFGFQFTGKGNG
jgi:hypothetical protein